MKPLRTHYINISRYICMFVDEMILFISGMQGTSLSLKSLCQAFNFATAFSSSFIK